MNDSFFQGSDHLPEECAQLLASLRTEILDALRKAGIASVKITYNGYGDNGQIDTIAALRKNGSKAKINVPCMVGDQEATSLREALDDFAWTVLGVLHDGFENDEGGRGTFNIDVTAGKVTLDHFQRFTDDSYEEI